jgi:catechol 2,3-dioxygenase-like lactoylglutathione lyase family enzyme
VSLASTQGEKVMSESLVNVRYMVSDVQQSTDWYVGHLGFRPVGPSSPAFAAVERGAVRLLLSGRGSSAGRPMPDGRQPEPGGWNRLQLVFEDLAAEVQRLRGAGVRFRNDILTGPGGSQILAEDPSGNVVELFQPAAWG